MALNDFQKEEARRLFAEGRSVSDVYKHLGAKSAGFKSPIEFMPPTSVITEAKSEAPQRTTIKAITDTLGLSDATQTFGNAIARTRLGAAFTGTDVETNRQYIPAPTGKEITGAVLKTGATAAGVALAPASLTAQMVAGGALGYAYDVGGDLLAGSSAADTVTPGAGTAFGVAVPPVFKGLGRFFKGPSTAATADDLARMADGNAQQAAAQPKPALVSTQATEQINTGTSAIKQTGLDLVESMKRVGTRITEKADDQTAKAARLANATPAVKEAINTGLDDTMIEFATKSDPATKAAARKMVQIAESPKKMGVNARPSSVAEDVAIKQYTTVLDNKKKIGEEIGKMSDSFDTLKSIDVVPTQNTLLTVMKNNGIGLDIDGKLIATDNFKVTDEQLTVINKLFDKVTKQNTLSAKNLHELDQWFSTIQRQSRLTDKIDDVYVKVPLPDGTTKDVNIFKVFRDAFGQRLDEVAPENLRTLNRQYRQYSNFLEDVEGRLVTNPEFSDLVGKNEMFAEAGLRRIFGEGKGAAEREIIYEALDKLSRDLGYKGARADELYIFSEKLKALYPETIKDISFRGQIGASIMDKIGSIMDTGKPMPQDQQKALKMLLEEAI